jgi:uncharacterized membrane protein YtjA (UPF0391 family)
LRNEPAWKNTLNRSGDVTRARGVFQRAHPINQLGEAHIMLKWALVFLVISLIAGIFGFTGIAAGAAAIAKVLFFLALLLFVVFLVLGLTIFKSIT